MSRDRSLMSPPRPGRQIRLRALGRALCLLVVVAAVSPSGAAAAGLAGAHVSALGIGPLRFGMTPRQASSALGSNVRVLSHTYTCGFWNTPGLPRGRLSLVSFGADERLTLAWPGPGLRTTRGIKVGDSLQKLHRRYRHLKKESAEDLGVHDEDLFADQISKGKVYTLMFSIYQRKVTFMSAGLKDTVRNLGECA